MNWGKILVLALLIIIQPKLSAKPFNNDSTNHFTKKKQLPIEYKSYHQIENNALNLIQHGQYSEALLLFDSIYRFSTEMLRRFPEDISINIYHSRIETFLGSTYEELGDAEKAFELYTQALKICEAHQLPEGKSRIYNNIGKIYFLRGKEEKAKEYFEKAMKINREIKLYTFLTDNLNNLADVAIIQNNRELGEKYALEALEYSKQFEDSNYLAYAYMNLGGIYKDSKRYDTALTMLNKALDIQVTNNYSDMMIATLLKVGQVYQVTGKQKLAIEKGYKAKTLALKLNHLPGKARVYQHLSNFYKTSNLDSAMYYMTLYYSTKDSLFKVNSENRLHELETLFQVREKDKQIQSYKNEVEFQEKTRRLLLYISLALAIIAILLFYFFRLKSKIIKQNKLVYEKERRIQEIILEKKDKENRLLQTEKKKKELEAKLISEKLDLEKDISERKSRELSTSVMHMTNKNEILNKIKDQLEDTDLTQSSKIKDIIYEIKQSIRLDTDWEQFKLHFEAVNPNFFNTLKQKYPDISQNELKLCAYLRMNLSSKEIAQMSNISIAGVNKSRQRLRKKLNIDSDVNLVELMLKY